MTAASCSMSPSAVSTAPRPGVEELVVLQDGDRLHDRVDGVATLLQSAPARLDGAREAVLQPGREIGPDDAAARAAVDDDDRTRDGDRERHAGHASPRRRANRGWACSRYQPNARSATRRRPTRRSAAVSARGGSAGTMPLQAERAAERPCVARRERAVALERLVARRAALDDRPQLAPARDPEVERGADPLAREREAVPSGVAHEEHAVPGGRAQPVREPVALVAHGLVALALGEADGRHPHVLPRLVGARRPTRTSRPRRDGPAVPAADEVALDPDVQLVGVDGRVRDGPPGRARVARRVAGSRHPASSTRRQPRASTTMGRAGRRDRSRRRRRSGPGRAPSRTGRRSARTAAGTARGSRTPTSSRAGDNGRVPCGVVKRMHGSSLRIAPWTPIACSHGVGAAHALVARSPTS